MAGVIDRNSIYQHLRVLGVGTSQENRCDSTRSSGAYHIQAQFSSEYLGNTGLPRPSDLGLIDDRVGTADLIRIRFRSIGCQQGSRVEWIGGKWTGASGYHGFG